MSADSAFTARSLSNLRAALADWSRTEGRTWIFICQALIAAFLGLGIAMRLEMPQPGTVMVTVFVLMQPQSGAVLAKSVYRFVGTIVGIIAMTTFISLFSQQSELFIGAIAIWIGICVAGAARNRNFRSYGFLLSGYTVALAGIPAVQQPETAYLAALNRGAEVLLGVVCAGVASALVVPQYATEQMRTKVRARYSAFVEYVAAALGGRVDPERIERTIPQLLAEIVGFEAMRSAAVFEGPESRRRAGRLARLNSEFMKASTRFHALLRLMKRLRAAGATQAVDAIEPYFKELAPLLHEPGEPVLSALDAERAATKLDAFKATLPRRVRAARVPLAAQADFPLLEFDTASELLYRFVEDMHAYTLTYASLAHSTHERERSPERYEPKTNPLVAAVAGVRTFIVISVLGAFWIETAWPSGGTLVFIGAAVCSLASSSPQPTKTALQLSGGSALAAVVGFVLVYLIFPHIDGFPLLCAALTPALTLGLFIFTRPGLGGYGTGYLVFFSVLAGPANLIEYNAPAYVNQSIALVLGMTVSALAYSVLLPPSTPWLRAYVLRDLRHQLSLACVAPLGRVRARFESRSRDLAFQAFALAAGPDGRREALAWLVAVLDIGQAVIDLRGEVHQLPRDPRYAPTAPWRQSILKDRKALLALLAHPEQGRLGAAIATNYDAIVAVQQTLAAFEPPRDERHRLQRILSYLHFVRTALLDAESPLAASARSAGSERNKEVASA